ncbi:MAG: DUF2304 domain-containing protein, partial [Bacteroidia bacterium]
NNINPYVIQVVCIALTALFLLFIFRLIVRRKLREEFSIIWIITAIILNVLSFWRGGLDLLARLLGVYYAPSLLFMLLFFAIIVYLVHLSVINTRQQDKLKMLAQEMALLKEKFNSLNKV